MAIWGHFLHCRGKGKVWFPNNINERNIMIFNAIFAGAWNRRFYSVHFMYAVCSSISSLSCVCVCRKLHQLQVYFKCSGQTLRSLCWDSGSVGCPSRKWRKLHLSSFTFPCFLNRLANVLCGPYNAARHGRYSPSQVSFNYFLFIFWFSFQFVFSAFNARSSRFIEWFSFEANDF